MIQTGFFSPIIVQAINTYLCLMSYTMSKKSYPFYLVSFSYTMDEEFFGIKEQDNNTQKTYYKDFFDQEKEELAVQHPCIAGESVLYIGQYSTGCPRGLVQFLIGWCVEVDMTSWSYSMVSSHVFSSSHSLSYCLYLPPLSLSLPSACSTLFE